MPETDNTPDPAREKFWFIQLVRIGGLLLILGGILIATETVSGPPVLGYGLLVFGVFEFFYLPVLLARRWKTPNQ